MAIKKEITPQEAVTALIENGWPQTHIAAHCLTSAANVSKIYQTGSMPAYDLGDRLIKLAYKHGNLKPSRKVTR